MAWTEVTRQQYRREALRYASDLTVKRRPKLTPTGVQN